MLIATAALGGKNSKTDSLLMAEEAAVTAEDYLLLSQTYMDRSVTKAIELGLVALERSKQAKIQALQANAHKNLGIGYYYAGMLNKSVGHFDTALAFYAKTGDSIELGNVYNNLGVINSDFGRNTEAINYYIQSLGIKRLIDDSAGIGNTLNNIGAIYYDMQAWNEALKYFNESYIIANRQDDPKNMLTSLNNIGLIYMEQQENEKAIAVFRDCVHLGKQLDNTLGTANAYHNLGTIYNRLEKPDSAMAFLSSALNLFDEIGVPSGETHNGIGQAYYKQKNYPKALQAFKKALQEAEFLKDRKLKLRVYQNLFELYLAKNDNDNAIKFLLDYHRLFDTLRSLNDSTTIRNLQARFEVDASLKEIELLKQEQELQAQLFEAQKQRFRLQRFALHLSLTGVVLFLTLLILLLRTNRKLEKASATLREQNKAINLSREQLNRSNHALTEKEELLRTLINATPDYICFKDGDGRWLEVNEAATQVFNLTREELLHRTDKEIAQLCPPQQSTFFTCHLSDSITWEKGRITRQDEKYETEDSGSRTFDVIKVPIFNPDGSRKGLIVIGRDITDRKDWEEKIEKALKQAEESDKLKTAFLSNMSHEIRTPLNAIIGFSDLLDDDTIGKAEKQQYIRLVYENGNALLSLIDDIIDLARIESGEMRINTQHTDVTALFVDVFQTYKGLQLRRKKENIKLELDIPKENVVGGTDGRKLRQILINLMDNALKFTDEGSITMGFRFEQEPTGPSVIQLFVRDTGIGIPEEKQPQIFKRFVKLNENNKRLYPGTGLGLSIVEQFTRLLGGSLSLKSEVDKGTAFTIILPLTEASARPVETANEKETGSFNFSGLNLLLVEDVASNMQLLEAILKPTGARLLTAVSGTEAVEQYKNNPTIDLVLMDVQLPGIDGLEATRILKSLNADIPVLMQTAFALAEEKQACFEAGCDEYLAKPLRASILLPAIKQLVVKKKG